MIVSIIKKYEKFFKFVCVGISNTIISLTIYYLLKAVGVNYLIATCIGYIISSITGYFFNKLWVFGVKEDKNKSIVKYYVLYISALLLNLGLMKLQVSVIGISDNIAPLITLVITTLYNYTFSKIWVFRKEVK